MKGRDANEVRCDARYPWKRAPYSALTGERKHRRPDTDPRVVLVVHGSQCLLARQQSPQSKSLGEPDEQGAVDLKVGVQ